MTTEVLIVKSLYFAATRQVEEEHHDKGTLHFRSQTKTVHFPCFSYCFFAPQKDGLTRTLFEPDEKGEYEVCELAPDAIDRNMRQFSLLAVRVLRNASNKGHNEYRKQAKKEVMLSELQDSALNQLYSIDNYHLDDSIFNVLGLEIIVRDSHIANVLDQLSERHRSIILLKYYAKWTDKQIADAFNLQRQTIQFQRKSTLRKMEQMLYGGQNCGG